MDDTPVPGHAKDAATDRPKQQPLPLRAILVVAALCVVGWYLVVRALEWCAAFTLLTTPLWMLALAILVALGLAAYFLGGVLLGRLAGKRGPVVAAVAAAVPILMEVPIALAKGTAPWTDSTLLVVQVPGIAFAVLGALRAEGRVSPDR